MDVLHIVRSVNSPPLNCLVHFYGNNEQVDLLALENYFNYFLYSNHNYVNFILVYLGELFVWLLVYRKHLTFENIGFFCSIKKRSLKKNKMFF